MQIGTTGAAYGPGFAMSRPTLGAGQPLAPGSTNNGGFARRNRIMPMLPRGFDISVHQNELANRVAALQIARHPILAGAPSGPSPLMAAHAALAAGQNSSPLPPPLIALPQVDAAWDGPSAPIRPGPPPTGLIGTGKGKPNAAQTRDLLARVALARRGMRA